MLKMFHIIVVVRMLLSREILSRVGGSLTFYSFEIRCSMHSYVQCLVHTSGRNEIVLPRVAGVHEPLHGSSSNMVDLSYRTNSEPSHQLAHQQLNSHQPPLYVILALAFTSSWLWPLRHPGFGLFIAQGFMAAGNGALRAREFEGVVWEKGSSPAAAADVLRVHDWSYLRHLQARSCHFHSNTRTSCYQNTCTVRDWSYLNHLQALLRLPYEYTASATLQEVCVYDQLQNVCYRIVICIGRQLQSSHAWRRS